MLNSTVTKENNADIVYLKGKLNASTANELHNILKSIQTSQSKKAVLDFSALSYASSHGLMPLLQWHELCASQNIQKPLCICSLHPLVRQIFDISGLAQRFTIYESKESALHG